MEQHFYCEIVLQNEEPHNSKKKKSMRRMAHLQVWIKEDQGEELPQTQKNIEVVRQRLERNQGRISARRNGWGISPSLFYQIIKKDLPWYPYKMIRRHSLKVSDYERHSGFCQWFLHQCNDRRFLANFVISDEGGFALNGAVNNHNVRMYVPANQPQYCHYSVNDSRPKLTLWLGLCGNGDMFLPRRKP